MYSTTKYKRFEYLDKIVFYLYVKFSQNFFLFFVNNSFQADVNPL